MVKKKDLDKIAEEVEQQLAENEEPLSRDDIGIEIAVDEDHNVYVKFTGFEDEEDAEEYADFLTNNLPLLLFESTSVH